jgi:CO dehydrogenase/acetyl-CoA synthase alpha subunit
MSKLICTVAIDGATAIVAHAVNMVEEAIKQKGLDAAVGFPNTNYYLPVIYSFTGKKMKTLADLRGILEEAKTLLPEKPSENVCLPYFGNALDAGAALSI